MKLAILFQLSGSSSASDRAGGRKFRCVVQTLPPHQAAHTLGLEVCTEDRLGQPSWRPCNSPPMSPDDCLSRALVVLAGYFQNGTPQCGTLRRFEAGSLVDIEIDLGTVHA